MEAAETTRTRRGRPATGTLELRKSGWYVRLFVTIDGESVRKWFALDTHDKAVAKRKAARMVKSAAQRRIPKPINRVETYAEAAERIRAMRLADGTSPKMVAAEMSTDRLYAVPVFGNVAVTDITPAHVCDAMERCTGSGRSAKTSLHVRANIGIVFSQLFREGSIPENPLSRITGIVEHRGDVTASACLLECVKIALIRGDTATARRLLSALDDVRSVLSTVDGNNPTSHTLPSE